MDQTYSWLKVVFQSVDVTATVVGRVRNLDVSLKVSVSFVNL